MPVLCCVPNCSNRGGFKFPNDKKLQFAWRIAIKRNDNRKRLWEPSKFSRVCEKHFLADDFKTVDIESTGAKRRRCLKTNVIPSLFDHSTKVTESARKRQLRKLAKEEKSNSKCQNNELSKLDDKRDDPSLVFSDEIGVQELEIKSTNDFSEEPG